MKIPLLLCTIWLTSTFGQECPVSVEEFYEAGKKMFYVGDHKAVIPKDADTGMDQYCKTIQDSVNTAKGHLRCLKLFARTVGFAFANGFRKEGRKGCASKSWRADFVEVTQCLEKNGQMKEVHHCMDRLSLATIYVRDNVPVSDQLPAVCCYISLLSACFREKASPTCGRKAGELFYKRTNEVLGDVMQVVCANYRTRAACDSKYSKLMKTFDEIAKKEVTSEVDPVMPLLLDLVLNQVN